MASTEVVQPTVGLRAKKSWTWLLWMFVRLRPLGAIGGIAVALLVLTAVFAPVIATDDPNEIGTSRDRLRGPGTESFFGTDILGRDQFSRIVHGARVSLFVGLVAWNTAALQAADSIG